MAYPHTPQRGPQSQAPPPATEVSYSAYSPSPSSVDAYRRRSQRIEQWTNQVPQSPSTTVGAKTAVWSDSLGTVSEEGYRPVGARSRERGKPPSSNGHSNGHSRQQPQHFPAPPLRRQPPVPLLAQTPQHYSQPQPELPRGEHLTRSPSFNPSPASACSARYARDAYLNQALELPLDMLTEVAAPDEVYLPEPAPKPGRVGTILSRARSTVGLKGAAAGATPQQSAAPLPSVLDQSHALSHSQSKAYTRRQSQQSLRSVPEMQVWPKLPVHAHAPQVGLGPETRPAAAQSPAYSYEDSKCSSMQTSDSGHSFVKADAVPLAQSGAFTAEPHTVNGGTSHRRASLQPAIAGTPSSLNQNPIPASQLTRRTTSKGNHQAQSVGVSGDAGGPVEQITSPRDIRSRYSSAATGRRPVLTKSASVDGQFHTGKRLERAPSLASEHTAYENGIVFSPSSASVANVRDNGDHITFEVPAARRGKLHVSLAWFPGRRGAQSQPDPRGPAASHGASAPDRRASLHVPPHARETPTRRRSLSASEVLNNAAPGVASCPAPLPGHGAPQHGAPAGSYVPGVVQPHAPGFPLYYAGQVPQHLPAAQHFIGPQIPLGMPPAVQQVAPGGYPMQPSYSYPPVQPPMQVPVQQPPGILPWTPGPVPLPHMPTTASRPPVDPRATVGRGAPPGHKQTPPRAATFPAPSPGSPWRKLWPFGKHHDTFLTPAATKTTRFAEPHVTDPQTQKDLDRQRRAQRRDERAKRKSTGADKQGERGNGK
ncbi:hypothetical protein CC85DRAFT_191369 [Cutaneotrichosporon oleaginosum]|uniref:Uncharacterized protein n=1 Tax=Cutaneotrichosporon oleaginosum TaxID=879819 RepID=A0A0J0XV41_9TREE|nr:uncharacterized protein CC85DRAFT_191369 [Cutaneotrichosporon oleaginosum]KLT44933.1 hypothetical protein CC85DRAFT_191369 [Cutaneotrichosporon oleaginosum]TXT12060.1 hypothetical protein COLE_02470 [Cutaneotrichosporon oleaginosum]